MNAYTFTAVFEKEPGTKETYNVSVPALPGCLTFGESLREAQYNIQEAMEGYLESLLEDGQPIPNNKKVRPKKNALVRDVVVVVKHEVNAGFPTYETSFAASA